MKIALNDGVYHLLEDSITCENKGKLKRIPYREISKVRYWSLSDSEQIEVYFLAVNTPSIRLSNSTDRKQKKEYRDFIKEFHLRLKSFDSIRYKKGNPRFFALSLFCVAIIAFLFLVIFMDDFAVGLVTFLSLIIGFLYALHFVLKARLRKYDPEREILNPELYFK